MPGTTPVFKRVLQRSVLPSGIPTGPGDSPPFDAGEEASKWIAQILKALGMSSEQDPSSEAVQTKLRKTLNLPNLAKEYVVQATVIAWVHTTQQCDLIRRLKEENKKLSVNLISSQQKIIQLQGKLLECKEDKLQRMRSTVHSSVNGSLVEENKFCSEVARSTSPQSPISTAIPQQVVEVVDEAGEELNIWDMLDRKVRPLKISGYSIN